MGLAAGMSAGAVLRQQAGGVALSVDDDSQYYDASSSTAHSYTAHTFGSDANLLVVLGVFWGATAAAPTVTAGGYTMTNLVYDYDSGTGYFGRGVWYLSGANLTSLLDTAPTIEWTWSSAKSRQYVSTVTYNGAASPPTNGDEGYLYAITGVTWSVTGLATDRIYEAVGAAQAFVPAVTAIDWVDLTEYDEDGDAGFRRFAAARDIGGGSSLDPQVSANPANHPASKGHTYFAACAVNPA